MDWINWTRAGAQFLAGAKLTAAVLSYLGIGQIGKWLFETFYPFTRLMWGDLFLWLNIPNVSDIEKDALTAVLFFLPLGVSSTIRGVRSRSEDNISRSDIRSDRFLAIIFGMIFVLVICWSLLANLIRSNGV